MGLFSKKTKTENEIRLDEVIKRLSRFPSEQAVSAGLYLERIKNNPDEGVIKPIYLYTDILDMVMANLKDFMPSHYMDIVKYAEELYKKVFIYDEETPDFDELERLFIEFFDEDGIAARRAFDETFFNFFKNKLNYLRWFNSVKFCQDITKYSPLYIEYALEARCYFPDEDMFTANVINATIKIYNASNVQDELNRLKKQVGHIAGVYNVDEERIMEAEVHLDGAEAIVKKATDILDVVNKRMATIDSITKTSCDKVQQLCNAELVSARAELENIAQKLDAAYEDFSQNEKKKLTYDRQKFTKELFDEAEAKLGEMKAMSRTIINSASAELMRLNKDSDITLTKINDYLSDDGRVAKLLGDVEANRALMDKVDKLMILNDRNLERIINNVEDNSEKAKAASIKVEQSASSGIPAQTVVAAPTSVIPVETNVLVIDDEPIGDISYFFDENVPFKTRFKAAMDKKKEMIAKGHHFHKAFDDVLIAVMENSNPYLIGPSGCGKTYMISQIAKILSLDFIDIGYINEEYDILGFQTANGGYSCPNFYRCYKHGKIAFLDELDNGNSRATVKLNSFLSNKDDASYSFPHGENVRRHPNFRMIAAGNTAGNGADSNYNTREKIEESVQQRMTAIVVGYDNEVEKKILSKYPEWYEFIVHFRNATDEWSNGNYADAPGIITTRDVSKIRQYLDHGSFNDNKIIDFEFIETKSPDYLAFLADSISRQTNSNSLDKKLVEIFISKVENIRKKK